MEIVIPSRRRAATIRRHSLRLFPHAIVLVDERERDDYAPVAPRLITHPSLPTLGRIRQYALDTINDEVLIMADDDVTCCTYTGAERTTTTRDPERIASILEVTAQCAMDAGCSLFGFNQTAGHRGKANLLRPFLLSSWVGTVIGFIGRSLRYDPRISNHDDIDICVSALLRDRIIWQDNLHGFVHDNGTGTGGLSSHRRDEEVKAARDYLLRKWGSAIKMKTSRTRTGLALNISRKADTTFLTESMV